MKWNSIKLAHVLLVAASILFTRQAYAQTPGKAGFEGYVTDATGKPLEHVFIEVRFYTNADGGAGFTGTTTDANGYFILETFPGTSEFGVAVVATCRTSKGIVTSTQPMYWTIREQVYRRDFRLTLPKKVTGCLQ